MRFRDYITYCAAQVGGTVCYVVANDITVAYVKNMLNDTLLRLLYPRGVF